MIRIIFLLLLLCISGCSQTRIASKSKKTFSQLKKTTEKRYNSEVLWNQSTYEPLESGLSRQQAIELAMRNNPQLQADLETLGIANADLAQAGLYTNPFISSVFRLPKKCDETANIETDFIWNFSDLWQVPLRKKVASDGLEITSLRVLQSIFNTYTQANIVYDTVIYWQLLLKNGLDTYKKAKELNKQIKYRFNFGYVQKYDIELSNAQLNMFANDILDFENQLTDAILQFKNLMHVELNYKLIPLSDNFSIIKTLPSEEDVITTMLNNRPELQIAYLNIQLARHTISLEKGRVFDNVGFGIGLERGTDGTLVRGPLVTINFPIFDLNQAQIKRAKFILQQHEDELHAIKYNLITETKLLYQSIETDLKKLPFYQKILTSYKKATQFGLKYGNMMQLNWTFYLQAQVDYYLQKKMAIDLLYSLSKTKAQLERAMGASLDKKFKLNNLPIDKLI